MLSRKRTGCVSSRFRICTRIFRHCMSSSTAFCYSSNAAVRFPIFSISLATSTSAKRRQDDCECKGGRAGPGRSTNQHLGNPRVGRCRRTCSADNREGEPKILAPSPRLPSPSTGNPQPGISLLGIPRLCQHARKSLDS